MKDDLRALVKQRLVVVGNGMAGMRTVEELIKLAPELYEITVLGAEPHPNYNRILLSPVLAGEKTLADIMLNDEAWYAERGITLHKGKTVVRIDRASGDETARVPVGAGASGVALGGGSVWVSSFLDRSVSRIDPRTNTVGTTIAVHVILASDRATCCAGASVVISGIA